MSIPDGMILGAYGGCVGVAWAPTTTLDMPRVRHKKSTYPFAVSAAHEAWRGTDPVQAGLYNACRHSTLRGSWFKCCLLSCMLFRARCRLSCGKQLTWNYDGGKKTSRLAFMLSRAEAAERPAARSCRCAGSDDCPAGRFF